MLDVVHSRSYDRINSGSQMLGNRWFPGAKLNYAENLLRRVDDAPAIISWNESGDKRRLTFRELRTQVAACAAALRSNGIVAGDRVAAYMPNVPEAVIMMLATTSIGAIWSSCSPDFGLQGVLDRFQQIEPKILLAVDSYSYHGKVIDRSETLKQIVAGLPSVKRVVISDRKFLTTGAANPKLIDWSEFVQSSETEPTFAQLDFDHPIYILYSSGTTGAPKCIVHGAGGTLAPTLQRARPTHRSQARRHS